MEMHNVISKLEFMRNGYQKLIDENVDCGTIVGTDITGTWKAETPLNDVYKQHIEALDTAIKALSAQPERKTYSSMTDIEFDEWLYVHGVCTNKPIPRKIVKLLIEDAINESLSARPEQKSGRWIEGKCSECGEHAPFWSMASTYYESKFCPNCGAKMVVME